MLYRTTTATSTAQSRASHSRDWSVKRTSKFHDEQVWNKRWKVTDNRKKLEKPTGGTFKFQSFKDASGAAVADEEVSQLTDETKQDIRAPARGEESPAATPTSSPKHMQGPQQEQAQEQDSTYAVTSSAAHALSLRAAASSAVRNLRHMGEQPFERHIPGCRPLQCCWQLLAAPSVGAPSANTAAICFTGLPRRAWAVQRSH